VTDLPWFSEDAARLRKFLESETGQRMMARLLIARPSFLPASAHPHKSFAQSRDIAGYEQAIQELTNLTLPPPELPQDPTRKNYPDLEDDSAWEK
jgi:hypothetical protein